MIKETEGTILHHNILSQKEQQVKSKIFSKSKNPAHKIMENKTNQSKINEEFHEKNLNFKKNFESISEKQVGEFLKNMEDNFKKLAEKESSIGMVQKQNLLFNQRTETMEKNQENIIKILEKGSLKNKKDSSKENMIFVHEMLKPIKKELEGIQESYKELKNLCSSLQNKTPEKKQPNEKEIGEYYEKHSNFKQKIQQAQATLDAFLPQNIAMISNVSQKTVEIYTKCVEDFKSKMETLQNDAEKAERNLGRIYSWRLEKPIPQIQQTINPLNVNVDFKASYDLIMSKLDGEFDYNRFLQYCEKKKGEFYSEISDLQNEFSENQMTVPPPLYSIKEIQSICIHPPSILEQIKKRINFDEQKKTYLNRIQRPESVQPREKTEAIFNKKNNNRPKSIQHITTQPKSCPKDIKFEKKKEAFETVFEAPKKKPNRIFEMEETTKKQDQETMFFKKSKNHNEKKEEKLKLQEESPKVFKEETILKDDVIQSTQRRDEYDDFLENFLSSNIQSSKKQILKELKSTMQPTLPEKNTIKLNDAASEPIKTLNYEDLFTKNFEESKKDRRNSFDIDLNEIPFDIGLHCMKKDQTQKEVLQIGENLLKERLKIFAKNLTDENTIAKNIFKIEEEKDSKKNEPKNIFGPLQSENIDNKIEFDKNLLENQANLITNNVLELINTAIKTINQAVNQNVQNYAAEPLKSKERKPSEEQRKIQELRDIQTKSNNLENNFLPYNSQNLGNENYFQAAQTFDTFNIHNMPAFQPQLPIDTHDMFKDFVITESSEDNVSSVYESIARNKNNKNIYNGTNSSKSEGEFSLNELSESPQIEKTPFRNDITNDKRLLTENIFEDVSHESEFSEGEIRIRNIFGNN